MTNHFEYVITDHLGNNVVLFVDDNNDGEITDETEASENKLCEVLQRNFYYSFGMNQAGWTEPNVVGQIPSLALNPENKYFYNSKELHDDGGLSWLNYGARFYLSRTRRVGTIQV